MERTVRSALEPSEGQFPLEMRADEKKRTVPVRDARRRETCNKMVGAVRIDLLVQVSLPVVDNNRKVVGALSVVGEKFRKMFNVGKFCKIFRDF